MYLVLLGAPGVGKGTQSKFLVEQLEFTQLSTGDILREEIKSDSVLGKTAKSYIDKGELLPDDLILEIIKNKLLVLEENVIFDGFPRTLTQAEGFDKILEELDKKIDKVINIALDDSKIEERLTGRLVCKSCGRSYHKIFAKPKKEGVCDYCNGDLYQRADDSLDSIKKRLEVYHKSTKPLIDYYSRKNILISVDGDREPEILFEELAKILKEEE